MDIPKQIGDFKLIKHTTNKIIYRKGSISNSNYTQISVLPFKRTKINLTTYSPARYYVDIVKDKRGIGGKYSTSSISRDKKGSSLTFAKARNIALDILNDLNVKN